ncbi:MAG: hypothetical protein FWH11_12680 [Micrococcales bacterium]|nr:hypothetical protein [Micrococcales bacterium]
MRKRAFAAGLAMVSALALSACGISFSNGDSKSTQTAGDDPVTGSQGPAVGDSDDGEPGGVSDDVSSDGPVQQSGESDSSFATRAEQFRSVSSGSQFPYECDDGPWSSTGQYQTVVLNGHCTDVNITHYSVEVWVFQADRVNVSADARYAKVVADQIGDLTIAGYSADVYAGTLDSVTVGVDARYASIYTGTIGARVTIQGYSTSIYYDRGSPSVTNTGKYTSVEKN